MRQAVVDIGTNTILMLIADITQEGKINVIADEHRIARLGKGVDEHGIVQPDTFIRVYDILSEYKSIALQYNVNKLFAFGTSALRDAKNKCDFIEFIKNKLSIDIQIISGEEEAECTFYGAISKYLSDCTDDKYAVLDIGGGSTELVYGSIQRIISSKSIDIGSVRLAERILRKNPPSNESIEQARNIIQRHIVELNPIPQNTKMYGVAGTLTTLAAIDLDLPQFDKDSIDEHTLEFEKIEKIFNQLKTCTLEDLLKIRQIHPLRADIILAGVLILIEVLKRLELTKISVSTRGLRYGLLLKIVK